MNSENSRTSEYTDKLLFYQILVFTIHGKT